MELVDVDWVLFDRVASDWVSETVLRRERVEPVQVEAV